MQRHVGSLPISGQIFLEHNLRNWKLVKPALAATRMQGLPLSKMLIGVVSGCVQDWLGLSWRAHSPCNPLCVARRRFENDEQGLPLSPHPAPHILPSLPPSLLPTPPLVLPSGSLLLRFVRERFILNESLGRWGRGEGRSGSVDRSSPPRIGPHLKSGGSSDPGRVGS